ncbi:MAG: vitamin K epoxide reductase family protein [Solirubrobacterales bacterium]
MFSDQRAILNRDIPLEVAILFLVVFVIAVSLTVWAYRTGGARGEKMLRMISGGLCLLGLGVAAYIAYHAVIVNSPIQCASSGGGCALVEKSKYAHFLGIHLSIYGLIGYSAILIATSFRGDYARLAAFGLSVFGFGVSVLLRYLELWEINASCQWCVASAVLMTSLLVVNSTRLFSHFGLDDYEDDEPAAAETPPGSLTST